MRSCEFTSTPVPGRTKPVTLHGLVFRRLDRSIIHHTNPSLPLAEFITVTFQDQKNGIKSDSRTQQRTGDLLLCPVTRYASVVHRIIQTVPHYGPDTTIDTVQVNGQTKRISNTLTLQLLRSTCSSFGGQATFGFDPLQLGNRSIRSGAAMALFLQDVHTAKIMILGRWSSDAFLVYIRPQVLEWTNNMSREMIRLDTYYDAQPNLRTSTDDPRLRQTPRSFHGSASVIMPRFHLNHEDSQNGARNQVSGKVLESRA